VSGGYGETLIFRTSYLFQRSALWLTAH